MQSKQLSLMILMPEKQISAIIGRDGNTIKQIRNETMEAKIHISAKSVTSSDRAVSIRGDSISVNKACELICLELEKGSQDIKIVPCSKRHRKELSLKLVIPSSACSCLIGKGGETIQDIRKTTGCTVRLSTDNLAGSSDRLATVSGSSSAIAQCLERIGLILDEFPVMEKRKPEYYKHSQQESKSALESHGQSINPLVSLLALGGVISLKVKDTSSVAEYVKMTLSEKDIGAIIGNEGSKIADIRLKSGANISINKYVKTSKSREVVLTGNHHSVIVAQALINICLDQQHALETHRYQHSNPSEHAVALSKSDVTATVTMLNKNT